MKPEYASWLRTTSRRKLENLMRNQYVIECPRFPIWATDMIQNETAS